MGPYHPNPAEEDPEATFSALRRGDAEAWGAFVARYERLVYHVPRRMGLSEEECAEVFQETWASLVAQIERIERPRAIAAWIRTTARRQAYIVTRKRVHASSVHEVAEEEAPESPAGGPLPELLDVERAHLLAEALDELARAGGRCAELLRALFYEDPSPSYEELAERLGVRPGSLGPTRGRCLARLAEIADRKGLR